LLQSGFLPALRRSKRARIALLQQAHLDGQGSMAQSALTLARADLLLAQGIQFAAGE
jgi:hypothetical protein